MSQSLTTIFRNCFCSLSVSANNAMALAIWLWQYKNIVLASALSKKILIYVGFSVCKYFKAELPDL